MFSDRGDAGRRLAGALRKFQGCDPVVLALVRGGLPVAYEVASALGAPLDILLVRKIGAPNQPELAVGAVIDGPDPEIVVNEDIARLIGVSKADIDRAAEPELAEIRRRRQLYLHGRAPVEVKGRTAIVTDDGIATGATVRAALRAVRRQGVARLVLAVPIAPASSLEALRNEADEIVCLDTPEPFFAIGCFYRDFHQVGDEEVIDLLELAERRRASAETPPKQAN